MYAKTKAVMFISILMLATLGALPVSTQTTDAGQKIRSKLIDYGTGMKISVKMRDESKIVGKLASVGTDTFTVDVGKDKPVATIDYNDVEKVKKSATMAKWIVLGAVAGVAAIVLLTVGQRCRNEGGNALCF